MSDIIFTPANGSDENLVFLKLFRYHNSREIIKIGEYEKHIRMAREKLKSVRNAFSKMQHTVVCDLPTKGSAVVSGNQPRQPAPPEKSK